MQPYNFDEADTEANAISVLAAKRGKDDDIDDLVKRAEALGYVEMVCHIKEMPGLFGRTWSGNDDGGLFFEDLNEAYDDGGNRAERELLGKTS